MPLHKRFLPQNLLELQRKKKKGALSVTGATLYGYCRGEFHKDRCCVISAE